MLINKSNLAVVFPEASLTTLSVRIKPTALIFSKAVAKLFDLKNDEPIYFHFEIVDKNSILFIANKDEDGFKSVYERDGRYGLPIFSRPLVRYIRNQIILPVPATYYVQVPKGRMLEGCQAYEIITAKPINKIGK